MARERELYPIKLVRDRIHEAKPNVQGGAVEFWQTGRTTRLRLLKAKLMEEVAEYLIEGGKEELADILEVVECLAHLDCGISPDQLRRIQLAKRKERGSFMQGHVMYAAASTPQPADQQEGEHRG